MNLPSPTALIADDDEFFRMALNGILMKKLGFAEVIETASLDEAFEKLSEHKDISLVLFDLSIPGVEGPGNLRAVRECFPDARIAVVSGSNSRRDILLSLEAGVHGYVPKSLGIGDLTAALQSILEDSIYVPPLLADLPFDPEEPIEEAAPYAHGELASVLTPRQRDVLALLIEGKTNKEIARALHLGEGTVKVHMAALFRSLGVHTRAAAAVVGGKLLSAASAKALPSNE